MRNLLVLFVIVWPLTARSDRRIDEHTYAEPAKVRIEHLALDLMVDFGRRELVGTATLELRWADRQHRALVLDTRDLLIAKVEGLEVGAKPVVLKHALAKRDPIFGSKLAIAVDRPYPTVRITYRTKPEATGLSWVPGRSTAGGKAPFMFTQSQSIHGRSWMPLQDTPSVRFTYKARIRTPKSLVALMPANNDPAAVRDGDYSFDMPQPIPSYLMALAVGDVAFKAISNRSGVWAEPSILDRAHAELSDTEKMIQVAEALYGPYRWQRYDLVILPQGAPYGGTDHPRLAFLSTTALVGDKSLTSLVAHQLAHGWSGNLVTNASWKDTWLNEGFASYFESRIVEQVYGPERAEIENAIGEAELRERIAALPKDEQKLRQPPLPKLDRDEHVNEVAALKGEWFLRSIEQRFGRVLFDAFVRKWFERHAFQSVTTDDFETFLHRELLARRPAAFAAAELTAWLDGDGIPASAIPSAPKRLRDVVEVRNRWLGGEGRLATFDVGRWSTQEKSHFLAGLQTLTRAQLAELDRDMALTNTQNAELAQRWYPLAIRSGHGVVRPAISALLRSVGRRKVVIPIYRSLAETDVGLDFAKRVFDIARIGYHPITIRPVEKVLADKSRRPHWQARKP